MAEKFITVPAGDLDGNFLPTTLANAQLHATTSLTGLTNGQAYRTFVLQNPSPAFTPSASFAPGDDVNLQHWYNETSVTVDGSNQFVSWTDLGPGNGAGNMNLNVATVGPNITFNAATRTQNGLTVVDIQEAAGAPFIRSQTNILDIDSDFAFHGVVQVNTVSSAGRAIVAVFGANSWHVDTTSATQFDAQLDLSFAPDPATTGSNHFANWSTYSIIGDGTAGTLSLYVNNVLVAQSPDYVAANNTSDRVRFSTSAGTSIAGHGVGEFIITTSIDNRTSYHDYLVSKWGITV